MEGGGAEKSYNFHFNNSESQVNPELAMHTCSSGTGADGAAAGAWGELSGQVSGTVRLCTTSTQHGLTHQLHVRNNVPPEAVL